MNMEKNASASSQLNISLPAKLPPLVIFAYNRPVELKSLLESIQKQSILPPKLIAYVDGPKQEADKLNISKCIQLLEDVQKIPIEINCRNSNYGSRENVIQGITDVFKNYSTAVIIEDDVILSPHFYETLASLLEIYSDNKNIFSIGGYAAWTMSEYANRIPSARQKIDQKLESDFVVINRFSGAGGWATWANRWNDILDNLNRNINPYGQCYKIPLYPLTYELTYMAYLHWKHKVDAWDTSVALESLNKNYSHIVPKYSLFQNIGFNENATHTKIPIPGFNDAYRENYKPTVLPGEIYLLPEFIKTVPVHILIIFLAQRIFKKIKHILT